MRRLWHRTPVTELRSPDGACVVVADHGAHLLSWTPAGEGAREALFLSPASGCGDGVAIRGGVPVIFPQFAERGPGRRHGFARIRPWRLLFSGIEEGRAVARYELTDGDLQTGDLPADAEPGAPGRFRLNYTISAQGDSLNMLLTVTNTDSRAWEFTAALHTYLAVDDVAQVELRGLQGLRHIDQPPGADPACEQGRSLTIEGEVDRIYADVPGPLQLFDQGRHITLTQSGFADTIVWNPGAEKASALSDLTPGAEKCFLCVEAGAVLKPVTLQPGASWQGAQIISVC